MEAGKPATETAAWASAFCMLDMELGKCGLELIEEPVEFR